MVIRNGAKMSKSKGNVVSPDDMIARYGADATRAYALFAAPPDRDLDWQEDGVAGVSRFLGRVYRMFGSTIEKCKAKGIEFKAIRARDSVDHSELNEAERKLLHATHRTIGKITEDFQGRWHFNTSIAELMKFVNLLSFLERAITAGIYGGRSDIGEIAPEITKRVFRDLVLLLAPFAPYLAAELWEQIGGEGELLRARWPKFDEALAREDEVEIPVQINGKLCNVIRVPAGASEDVVRDAALADEKVQAKTAGKKIVKIILVPGKLVNLVVK
jgi:leucyl-tRNA synthetase